GHHDRSRVAHRRPRPDDASPARPRDDVRLLRRTARQAHRRKAARVARRHSALAVATHRVVRARDPQTRSHVPTVRRYGARRRRLVRGPPPARGYAMFRAVAIHTAAPRLTPPRG